MAKDRSPQDQDKYVVRFPDGMRDRIADAAKANNRSMNSEIVARLEASFDGFGTAPTEEAMAFIRILNKALANDPKVAVEISDAIERMGRT